tara:strand:- start:39 stop:785 length:747 start_codon:yes stop_codon:yes gene_type:complete
MSFVNKVAVVTGGSSGMGAATVRALSHAGAKVSFIDVDKSGALKIAEETGSKMLVGDVSDSFFCEKAISKVVEEEGRIDILVNAAGIIFRSNGLNTDDESWRKIMSVNIDGLFFMCRAVLKQMVLQKSGNIINFGSIWGDVAGPGVAAYCASKGAVHQITRSLALEHVEDGIRINAVAPGEVNTPMLSSGRRSIPTEHELQKLADETIPMKRLAEPEEIAEVVMFLASEKSSYMTGSIVPVDAGYTAR